MGLAPGDPVSDRIFSYRVKNKKDDEELKTKLAGLERDLELLWDFDKVNEDGVSAVLADGVLHESRCGCSCHSASRPR